MKPLLVTDCDEVLLHMVRHFADWLHAEQGINFDLSNHNFDSAMTRVADTTVVSREEVWGLLDGFFPSEMARQTAVPHALEAIESIRAVADVVVLTNLRDHCQQDRVTQLARHGFHLPVVCNQGGKGGPVARLVEEYGNPVTVFIDDLAVHHESVARHAPQVHRLHMIAEPKMATRTPQAPDAHARIDNWLEAERWIKARFASGLTADSVNGSAKA